MKKLSKSTIRELQEAVSHFDAGCLLPNRILDIILPGKSPIQVAQEAIDKALAAQEKAYILISPLDGARILAGADNRILYSVWLARRTAAKLRAFTIGVQHVLWLAGKETNYRPVAKWQRNVDTARAIIVPAAYGMWQGQNVAGAPGAAWPR